jgi:hypothetical protein
MLEDTLAKMEKDPSLVLCFPRMIQVDQDGREISKYEDMLDLMDADPIVRFKRALTDLRLVYQLVGVIRTEVVRLMFPFLNQPGADCVYLAELCLYGKILKMPQYQYFRRFHEQSSSWDRSSDSHQIKHVLGAGTRRILFAAWKYHLGLMNRLCYSPLAFKSKMTLMRYLARRMIWDRYLLLHEIWQFLWSAHPSKPSTELK